MSFVGNQGTFTRGYKAVVMDMLFIYHLGYAIICVLGLFVHEFFYSFLVRNLPEMSFVFFDVRPTLKPSLPTGRCRLPSQLFDLVIREETLLNVIKSVTRNGRSIILTAVLAIFLVYFFSIIGFLFLKDDFRMEVDRLPAPGQSREISQLSVVSVFTGRVWTSILPLNC